MNAAFIFDTIILEKDTDFYGMTLNYDFFKRRYLSIYDSIIVSTRVMDFDKAKGTEGYRKVNGEKVEYIPINNYKQIPDAIKNRHKIKMELEEIIDQVDVVIIRMPSVLGILACNICNKKGKKYVIEMVACAWGGYIYHKNPLGKIIAPIMFITTKKYVKNAPNVIYVTNKFLQKRYPTKGKQCACSDVILNEFDDNDLRNRIKKIDDLNLKKMKICTVANVEMKIKGHIYVFKAIKKLKIYGYNIKYYMIGNGNKAYLEKKAAKLGISENVFFVGSVPHDDVIKEINNMDIYIQPSLQEGLPRALVEAMSTGIPAIGSNTGGIPELLNEKMIFTPKKTNQLVDIIKNTTKSELKKEARYNYTVATDYKPSKLNSRRTEFYKSI